MNQFRPYPFPLYIRRTSIIIPLGLSVVLNLLIWFWLLIQLPPTSDTVFLHYTMLFGVDLIGVWWKLLLIPISGVLILLCNFLIGWVTASQDKFVGELLMAVSVLAQIFLFSAMVVLVRLNT